MAATSSFDDEFLIDLNSVLRKIKSNHKPTSRHLKKLSLSDQFNKSSQKQPFD